MKYGILIAVMLLSITHTMAQSEIRPRLGGWEYIKGVSHADIELTINSCIDGNLINRSGSYKKWYDFCSAAFQKETKHKGIKDGRYVELKILDIYKIEDTAEEYREVFDKYRDELNQKAFNQIDPQGLTYDPLGVSVLQ